MRLLQSDSSITVVAEALERNEENNPLAVDLLQAINDNLS